MKNLIDRGHKGSQRSVLILGRKGVIFCLPHLKLVGNHLHLVRTRDGNMARPRIGYRRRSRRNMIVLPVRKK